MGVAWPTPEYNLPRGTSGLPVVTRPPPPPYPLRCRRIRPALPLGPARSGRAPSRCPAWPDPYLSRSGLPPEASRLPSGYSISRAVALASVDNSIPPDLLPRLRTVLAETRVCDGLYIRDLANIALDERAGSRPTPCPAGPSGDPPGPRAPCSRRPPGPGPAPTLPGPALPAAAPRELSPLQRRCQLRHRPLPVPPLHSAPSVTSPSTSTTPGRTATRPPLPPRMARHQPLRAPRRHPVLLSVAHPRSPTPSIVAEPGPTPGRPRYPPLAAAVPEPGPPPDTCGRGPRPALL